MADETIKGMSTTDKPADKPADNETAVREAESRTAEERKADDVVEGTAGIKEDEVQAEESADDRTKKQAKADADRNRAEYLRAWPLEATEKR